MRLYPVLVLLFQFAAPPIFALEPDQVYAKVAGSVVVVHGYQSGDRERGSFGSGVIIAPGQIITNCHVIKSADVINLSRDKYTSTGIVRYSDPERDFATAKFL